MAEEGGQTYAIFPVAPGEVAPWRSASLYHLLDRLLGLGMVPSTRLLPLPYERLLEAAPGRSQALAPIFQMGPGGGVYAAIVKVPDNTEQFLVAASPELAKVASLAEDFAPPPAHKLPAVESYINMLALDYLAGNVLRRTAYRGASGHLWLIDSGEGLQEHPEPHGINRLFEKLKRVRRFPPPLASGIVKLQQATLRKALLAQAYEWRPLHRRSAQEVVQRARALRSIIAVRKARFGGDAFLPP